MMRKRDVFPAMILALAVSASPAALAQSHKVTISACAMCHGDEGIARDGEVPNLAGQNERYLYKQMLAFRSGARKHQEMRYMARELTLEEIAEMAAYYAGLPPR